MAANQIEFTIKGTDKGSRVLTKFSRGLKTTIKGLAIAGAGSVAAASAVGVFVNKVTQAQDRIAKMGTRLGIATEDLSKFQFIAQRGGVSVENMGLAMQRMTRRVSEAAQGMGEAQDALKELNISAKELNAQPLPQQMTIIASRLKEVGSQADRVRLAFKLFDSEGVGAVLQTLDDLGPEFDAVTKDFEFLGGVVTSQAAANAEAFQNQMVRVKTSLFGLGQAISNNLAPSLTALSEAFANFVAENREKIAAFTERALDAFLKFFFIMKEIFSGVADLINETFGGSASSIDGFIALSQKAFTTVVRIAARAFPAVGAIALSAFVVLWESFVALAKEAWIKLFDIFTGGDVAVSFSDALTEGMRAGFEKTKPVVSEALRDISDIIKDETGVGGNGASLFNFEGIDAKIEDIKKNIESVKEEASDAAGAIQEEMFVVTQNLTQITEVGKESILAISDEVSEFVGKLDETITAQNDMFLEGMALREELTGESLTRQFEMATEFATAFNDLMLAQVQAVSDSVAGSIVEAESVGKALEKVAKQVLKSVIALLIKTGLQRLVLGKLSLGILKSEASAEGAKAIALTGANTFASVSAAPWPISLTAPAVAAAHVAGATGIFTSGLAAGAGLGAQISGFAGAAHGGLDFVPRESTFLLNRGERVVQPRANTDLTNFLNDSRQDPSANAGTRPVSVENISIEVLPNATNLDVLREISSEELEEELGAKIIEALNGLDRRGIRPNFAERNRGV